MTAFLQRQFESSRIMSIIDISKKINLDESHVSVQIEPDIPGIPLPACGLALPTETGVDIVEVHTVSPC